jgi:hypothetical protein
MIIKIKDSLGLVSQIKQLTDSKVIPSSGVTIIEFLLIVIGYHLVPTP